MGYKGQGPLSNNGHALVEPLSHTSGRSSKDTIGLGYGTKDDSLECSKNPPLTSDLELDMDKPPLYPMALVGDVIPSTSLLWGEEYATSDNKATASTYMFQETHESNFWDRK